jgi:hypothetical protein
MTVVLALILIYQFSMTHGYSHQPLWCYGDPYLPAAITEGAFLTAFGYHFTQVSVRLRNVTFLLPISMLALPSAGGITVSSRQSRDRYRAWGIWWNRRSLVPELATSARWQISPDAGSPPQ